LLGFGETDKLRIPDIEIESRPPSNFKYEAGQWVDLAIPGVLQIGGYSLVCAPGIPHTLARTLDMGEGPQFDLAVKRARHPPAAWVHGPTAAPGALVGVRVGGNFTLSTLKQRLDKAGVKKVLMLAGGVGINPLYSMLCGFAASAETPPEISLFYTARAHNELLFEKEIDLLKRGALVGRLSAVAWSTRGAGGKARLTPSYVLKCLEKLTSGTLKNQAVVVICGPREFSDELSGALLASGVPQELLFLEKWW